MKNLFFLLLTLLIVSCKTQSNANSKIVTTEKIPNFNIALKFVNDYAAFCEPELAHLKDSTWIERNPLLTENFKKRYKTIMDSADKADPVLGLECDPIFYSQYFDDKYVILKADTINGYVTMQGKALKESLVLIKLISQNNKWLVDGAGMINIPQKNY